MDAKLLEVQDLKKYFPVGGGGVLAREGGMVRAIDGVTFSVARNECLGVVGESGCGKTTLARCTVALERPTAGRVMFEGVDIFSLRRDEMKKVRSKIQIVFQDPYASLNPRWLIRDIVAEPLVVNGHLKRGEIRQRVAELLEMVGLNESHMYRFPHEFSGGQRQRIAIARALSINPEFIVLDEPTSSLDVSVQAQILNLLKELQQRLELTYLFISHNLSVIRHMATRIAVMYLGRIVEVGSTADVFRTPLHPYTRALLDSVPVPDPRVPHHRSSLSGDIPDPKDPPQGCHFNPRCPLAIDKCRQVYPELIEHMPNHYAACHLASDAPQSPLTPQGQREQR
jgi:oligopeptide transport system ATP-binding protein